MTTKVLVFCPLNPSYPHLWGRTVQSIFRLDWPEPLDWLFFANDNPLEDGYENVLHNYTRARAKALEGGYDYLLTVESDMIIPPDTIGKLLDCGADVAYGLYVFRHGRRTWSAYTEVAVKSGVSLSQTPSEAKALWGKVVDVAGVGLGCTLISRKVLEEIPFRLGENHKSANDWQLALDLQEGGYTQRAHLGVVCGHQTATPWPQIIWPDPDTPRLYRVESFGGEPTVKPGETTTVQVGMGTNAVYAMPRTGNL